ncbi:MAG: 50S ribosomal protein L21 [Firmicutes bacterium]|nr:50S ribosomal protein L21 [Bacillota bacterium]
MYAVIEAGGKQYRVQEGDVITVEKIKAEVGEAVTFNTLLISAEGEVKVGAPYLNEVVTGTVVEHGKGQKVIIFKYKAKKDYRKKQGHRQPYTMVKIEALGGAAPKKEAVVAEEVKEAKKVSASMKKDELIAFAKENNIEIDEKATKAVIIETIEAAL